MDVADGFDEYIIKQLCKKKKREKLIHVFFPECSRVTMHESIIVTSYPASIGTAAGTAAIFTQKSNGRFEFISFLWLLLMNMNPLI